MRLREHRSDLNQCATFFSHPLKISPFSCLASIHVRQTASEALLVEAQLRRVSNEERMELRTEFTALSAQMLAVRAAAEAAAVTAKAELAAADARSSALAGAADGRVAVAEAAAAAAAERELSLAAELRELRELNASLSAARDESAAAAEAAAVSEQMARLCALSGETDVLRRRNAEVGRLRRQSCSLSYSRVPPSLSFEITARCSIAHRIHTLPVPGGLDRLCDFVKHWMGGGCVGRCVVGWGALINAGCWVGRWKSG